MRVLVTGSSGLIGTALSRLLEADHEVEAFDIRNGPEQDIRITPSLRGYDGIVHLAAVSRVVTGERDPETCINTNVVAVKRLFERALAQPNRPWLIFASSREVYGDVGADPIHEDTPLSPLNVYARSKVEGERLSMLAREQGMIVNIARLSSVYGSIDDHADRVTPCFARAAARGGTIRVEGRAHCFDFTHIDDVARGLHALVVETGRRHALPPIHFVSGRGVTLGDLADLSARLSRAPVEIVEAPPRTYDVHRFIGDPTRAEKVLGWKASIPVEVGLERLIEDFSKTPSSSEP